MRLTETGANKRTVWTIPTYSYKGAHFATFPPKLVEPCILAGTSAKGRCPKCGAPWERIIEKNRKPTRPGADTKTEGKEPIEIGNRDPLRHVTESVTTGWRATCDCGAEVVPCVVLDPFMGSGTAAYIAKALGRNYIGIDLSEEYCELARRRIAGDKSFIPNETTHKRSGFFD